MAGHSTAGELASSNLRATLSDDDDDDDDCWVCFFLLLLGAAKGRPDDANRALVAHGTASRAIRRPERQANEWSPSARQSEVSDDMSKRDGLTEALLIVFTLSAVLGVGRYKRCSEGCCPHEFCAYERICYPRSKCRYGCPDGDCVGTGADKACVPYKLCTSWYDCGPGNVCTMHYNLGYSVCQYNLDIGSTLCRKGKTKRWARGEYDDVMP